ncbi:MAG: outer membrane lipoprotein LolB [Burkholderiales bacterium]|nr:outer membrane lipoprotein LolB [Burkholderiales bacterium]
MLGRRFALAALLALLLSACATRPPISADALSGRLSVRIDGHPDRSVSADFELSGDAREGQLLLSGPLGSTAAQARWAPGQATLTVGQQRNAYPDLDTLAIEALGERVPIAALFDWWRGRPWAEAASTPRSDGTAGFQQLGWSVSLVRWSDGFIEARRDTAPVVTVRARLERP